MEALRLLRKTAPAVEPDHFSVRYPGGIWAKRLLDPEVAAVQGYTLSPLGAAFCTEAGLKQISYYDAVLYSLEVGEALAVERCVKMSFLTDKFDELRRVFDLQT